MKTHADAQILKRNPLIAWYDEWLDRFADERYVCNSCRIYYLFSAVAWGHSRMLDYLVRWTDPSALSQVVGALIGAGIAIGLWHAERRRLEAEKLSDEEKRTQRFRATLRSAVLRLKRELELFVLQCAATRTEIQAKSERISTGDGYSRSITGLLERFPINIPNAFEFSDIHIDALSQSSTELMSELKEKLQEMFVEIRSLKAQATGFDDPEVLLDSLENAVTCGSRSIELISKLDGSLDKGAINRAI